MNWIPFPRFAALAREPAPDWHNLPASLEHHRVASWTTSKHPELDKHDYKGDAIADETPCWSRVLNATPAYDHFRLRLHDESERAHRAYEATRQEGKQNCNSAPVVSAPKDTYSDGHARDQEVHPKFAASCTVDDIDHSQDADDDKKY
jgi:hypothetical protein